MLCRWLGYKDSNLDYRSQNPTSCQLNDSPTVRKRELPDSPQMSSEKMAFPHNFFGNENLACSAQAVRLFRAPGRAGETRKKAPLEAGRSAFLLSQISFLLKARRSFPNRAGQIPGAEVFQTSQGRGRRARRPQGQGAHPFRRASVSLSRTWGSWGRPSGGPFQASGFSRCGVPALPADCAGCPGC